MGRADVMLQARAGATIRTTVYVNNNSTDNSLLGKKDTLRLGIVSMNTRGQEREVEPVSELETEGCHRIRGNRKAERIRERGQVNQSEVDRDMEELMTEYADIMTGIGKYKGDPVKIQVADNARLVI